MHFELLKSQIKRGGFFIKVIIINVWHIGYRSEFLNVLQLMRLLTVGIDKSLKTTMYMNVMLFNNAFNLHEFKTYMCTLYFVYIVCLQL